MIAIVRSGDHLFMLEQFFIGSGTDLLNVIYIASIICIEYRPITSYLFKPKHVCGGKNAKNYFLLCVEPLGVLDHQMPDEWNSAVPADELVV